jgi:hypothetical protein
MTAASLLVFAAVAQDREETDRSRHAADTPTEGIWPTNAMLERILDRIADNMAENYELNTAQLERTREVLKKHILPFLHAHRTQLKPLVNQFVEVMLNDAAPEPAEVAIWSQRLLPLLHQFGEVVAGIAEEERGLLNADQELVFDVEYAGFQTVVFLGRNQLGVWAAGGYDPQTEWIWGDPEGGRRLHEGLNKWEVSMDEAGRRVRDDGVHPDAAAADAAGVSRDRPTDEWTRYTRGFIRRYDLNAEQRQNAYTLLHQEQQRRDNYLLSKSAEVERVAKLLQATGPEEESENALDAYERLYAPVRQMFEQLKRRLNTLPTRAQRRAAAKAGLEADLRRKPESTTRPAPNEKRPHPQGRR